MNFSDVLVKLSEDFQFAWLDKIGLEFELKTKKDGRKYCQALINIPIELEKLSDIQDKFVIFLGILPKDKFKAIIKKIT